MKRLKGFLFLLLGLILGAAAIITIDVAWAQNFSVVRRLRILNAAGTGELDVQEGATGLPVTIISSPATMPVWVASQNKTLAQCGVGKTALDSVTARRVIIKPDKLVTDNVWCDVDGTVDVDDGFRVGENGEGQDAGIANSSTIECCGEGSAAFKISVQVEN